MLNVLIKTKPWMVASLLAATSVFGQDSCQPKPKPSCEPKPCQPCQPCVKVCPEMPQKQLIPAYNMPAGIDVRCSWDVWVDGSFTYWQAMQDAMEVCITDTSDLSGTIGADTITKGNIVNQNFHFKPGFKVAAGLKFDHDDWDAYAEYTWYRGTDHRSTSFTPLSGLVIPMVGHPDLQIGTLYHSASSSWRLHMDLVDAVMGRWYYVGTKLTFHPYAGARAAWIRQRWNTAYEAIGGFDIAAGSYTSHQNTNSWGVGPRMGLDMNWMIGQGFRLYSNAAADILFTRYQKLGYHDTFTNTGSFILSQRHLNTVRTHLDMEMGFGWGTYLDCNNWYLDLSAGYGFQVFFDQNMFSNYVDDAMTGKRVIPNGNLYIQGLTATVTLHF